MPWSNQSGGGWKSNGGGGGGSGGPWGSGPQGGGGPTPPDLEELIRRSQDKLKTALPGGGGNKFLIPLIILVLLGGWLYQCIYFVQPDELGVELLFGKPKEAVSEQGAHFHFWPVETVEKVATRQIRDTVGNVAVGRSRSQDSNMLSGDQNIVDVEFTIIWRVSDPAKFLFEINDPPDFIRRIAESAMREYIGRSPADGVRTNLRQEAQDTVRDLAQATLDTYDAGVTIVGIQLERADPPAEVADAFEEVQRAQQDQDKFKREAEAYANKRLGEARGEASKIREEAKAYKERVIAEADGEAQRFVSVFTEYNKAKGVTRQRLFLETMEKVLGESNKIIVEQGAGSGVVPYLPLPEVDRRARGSN